MDSSDASPAEAAASEDSGKNSDWSEHKRRSAQSAAPSPGAPSATGRAFERQEQAEGEDRPGLATTWGEDRVSPVSTAPFVRVSDRPFSVVSLHYNDEEGVRAMLGVSRPIRFDDGAVFAQSEALSVRLLDASGRPLPSVDARGRTYVIGEHGERYSLEIQNHTAQRFEAVATVDGLDVVDGLAGSFSKRGYLIAPFSTLTIDGFRRSMDSVAAFRFGTVRDSYAAKTGTDRNVGVIGVAFFDERGARPRVHRREIDRRHSADPFPGGFARPPEELAR
jgi:hypothetical protein